MVDGDPVTLGTPKADRLAPRLRGLGEVLGIVLRPCFTEQPEHGAVPIGRLAGRDAEGRVSSAQAI
jgi:hypothetical protein